MTSHDDDGHPSVPPGRPLPRRILQAHKGRTLADWGILVGVYSTIVLGFLGIFVNSRVISTSEESDGTANEANKNAETSGSAAADLELTKVSASISGGISGTQREGDSPPVKMHDLSGVQVDIAVRNLTNTATSVSKAQLVFRRSGYPEPCYAMGGPLVRSADYTFAVPDDQPFDTNTGLHKVPFSLQSEPAYEIPPHESGKFRFTVGPESIIDQGNPWFGVFDVVLEQNEGKKLKVGPVAVVGPSNNSLFHAEEGGWHIEKEHIPGCTRRNAALVAEVMRTPNLVASKEFADLDRSLKNYR